MKEIILEIVKLIIQAVFPVLAGVIVTWIVNLFREHIKNEAVLTAVKAFIDRYEDDDELKEAIIEYVRVKLDRWGIKFSRSEIEAMIDAVIKDLRDAEMASYEINEGDLQEPIPEIPVEDEPPLLTEPVTEVEAEPPVNGFDWKTVKHFKESEFYCPTCKNTGADGMNPNLIKLMDAIRENFGKTQITSGYRCAAYNKKVGGISGSQHTKGNACDFYIAGKGDTYKGRLEIIKWAIKYANETGLKFRYGYTVDPGNNGVGQGFYSDGVGKRTTSSTMGKAIHIDCTR